MRQVFIDTSFFIALVNKRDQHYFKAKALAKEFDKVPTIITDAIILEIGNALAKKFKKEAIELFEYFSTSPEIQIIHLTPSLLEDALDYYKRYTDKHWSLVDCISFVVMKERNISEALTFDTHFEQAGFTVLVPS